MKKLAVLIILIVVFMGSAFAQKPVLYVAPFKYEGKDIRKLLPAFRIAVLNGINISHRVDIIDRTDSQQIMPIDELLEDARKANADMILQCELLNHNLMDIINLAQAVSDAINNKASTIYDKLAYNIKLINVSDGVLITSKKYENVGGAGYSSSSYSSIYNNTSKSISQATDNALYWVSDKMLVCFESLFPLEARIVEVAEVKKDKVLKVYIDRGSNVAMREQISFNVYVEKMIAGEKTLDVIGRMAVMAVKGENRSLCRITKNPKGIKEALDNGTELILKTVIND